jgi:cob(I)alamin adenosyltransferase
MGVSLKTEQRRSHTTVTSLRPWVRRAEGYRGTCHIKPSMEVQVKPRRPYLHSLSRILFVFCFERDPHGLSHPFQKAKLLNSVHT